MGSHTSYLSSPPSKNTSTKKARESAESRTDRSALIPNGTGAPRRQHGNSRCAAPRRPSIGPKPDRRRLCPLSIASSQPPAIARSGGWRRRRRTRRRAMKLLRIAAERLVAAPHRVPPLVQLPSQLADSVQDLPAGASRAVWSANISPHGGGRVPVRPRPRGWTPGQAPGSPRRGCEPGAPEGATDFKTTRVSVPAQPRGPCRKPLYPRDREDKCAVCSEISFSATRAPFAQTPGRRTPGLLDRIRECTGATRMSLLRG